MTKYMIYEALLGKSLTSRPCISKCFQVQCEVMNKKWLNGIIIPVSQLTRKWGKTCLHATACSGKVLEAVNTT